MKCGKTKAKNDLEVAAGWFVQRAHVTLVNKLEFATGTSHRGRGTCFLLQSISNLKLFQIVLLGGFGHSIYLTLQLPFPFPLHANEISQY